MNAAAYLTRRLHHPWRWLSIFIFATIAFATISVFIQILNSGWIWSKKSNIDDLIWTCSSDFQTFYGPGTPQSLEIVQKIELLKQKNYLPDDFTLPNTPILITPAFFGSEGTSETPTLIYNFNLEMGRTLRDAHRPKQR